MFTIRPLQICLLRNAVPSSSCPLVDRSTLLSPEILVLVPIAAVWALTLSALLTNISDAVQMALCSFTERAITPTMQGTCHEAST